MSKRKDIFSYQADKLQHSSSQLTQSTQKSLKAQSFAQSSSKVNSSIQLKNQTQKAQISPQSGEGNTVLQWIKKKALQKMQKYAISVILLPNTIEGFVRTIFKHYYGYEFQFILVGILVSTLNFLLVSYFLYKWFVKGQGGIRQKVKQKLAQIQKISDQVKSYFVPGNEANLLKLYVVIVFAGVLSKILPDPVLTGGLGLAMDLYQQIKGFLFSKYEREIQYVQQESYKKILALAGLLPKYSQIQKKTIKNNV